MTMRYRAHIDGLRAMAVLAVLGFHAFPGGMRAGFLGVDIFFVISGFLISGILYEDFDRGELSGVSVIRQFYARRIRRIFPSLLIVLLACFGFGYVLFLPGELAKLSLQIIAAGGFCLNLLLAQEGGYFRADSTNNPLLHLWSLGVEEQFYLLWPLAIWVVVRRRARILPLAVFLAAFSYCWNEDRYRSAAVAAFYMPQTRMWELLIGAVTAAICRLPSAPFARSSSWVARSVANGLPLIGLALIAGAFSVVNPEMDLPNAWTLLPTLGAACVVSSPDSAWVNRWILSNRVLVWFGLISYPLYLWHWPLLSYSRIIFANPDAAGLKAAILLLSVLLAWLTFEWLERPVRKKRKTATITVALVAAMAAIVILGLFSRSMAGFPGRFPKFIQQLSDWHYDATGPWRQGTYFLLHEQDEKDFKVDPNEINPNKPTIYLWGDSHAASLYPGLRELYGTKYNIVERTASRTPPFIGGHFNSANGVRINNYVLASIRHDRPDYVILEAAWAQSPWEPVEQTIIALKAAGIPHIILFGPLPHWREGLPQQLFDYIKKHRTSPIPTRMTQGLDPDSFRVDRLMAAMAARLGVEYVSPCAIFSSKDGVLVRTGDTVESLTAFDDIHSTASGSKYLLTHCGSL